MLRCEGSRKNFEVFLMFPFVDGRFSHCCGSQWPKRLDTQQRNLVTCIVLTIPEERLRIYRNFCIDVDEQEMKEHARHLRTSLCS